MQNMFMDLFQETSKDVDTVAVEGNEVWRRNCANGLRQTFAFSE